jgi:hypothetical protein
MSKRARISEDQNQTSFRSSENELSQENNDTIMTPPPIVRQKAFNHTTWCILDSIQTPSFIENRNAGNNLN